MFSHRSLVNHSYLLNREAERRYRLINTYTDIVAVD